jgi:hypothetical protein
MYEGRMVGVEMKEGRNMMMRYEMRRMRRGGDGTEMGRRWDGDGMEMGWRWDGVKM